MQDGSQDSKEKEIEKQWEEMMKHAKGDARFRKVSDQEFLKWRKMQCVFDHNAFWYENPWKSTITSGEDAEKLHRRIILCFALNSAVWNVLFGIKKDAFIKKMHAA